jgi:hypothetical protein
MEVVMKARRRLYFLLPILILPTPHTQKVSGNSQQKPMETTVCQVLKDPSAYNNKLVRVRGSVSVHFEYAMLTSEGCEDALWFALADGSGAPGLVAAISGKGRPGGKDSKGRWIPPVAVKLVRDANFEKFQHYMNVKAAERPCFNDLTQPTPPDCDVDRVTATFIGRIDSVSKEVHQAHLKKSPREKSDFSGFGHMGLFDAQIVVQAIEEILVVDAFGRVKP